MKKSGLSELRSPENWRSTKPPDVCTPEVTYQYNLDTGRDDVTPDVTSQYTQEFVHLLLTELEVKIYKLFYLSILLIGFHVQTESWSLVT